jgi:hypothetical protein
MSIEDFFNDLWKIRADREKGHEIDDEEILSATQEQSIYEDTSEVAIYRKLEEQSLFNDDYKQLFSQMRKGILDYYRSMTTLERVILAGGSNEEISQYDQMRRFSHNSLIDTLNAMSRYCWKNGLDNEWRSMIGLERTKVTDWVKKVAPYLVLQEETTSRERLVDEDANHS